MSSILVIFSPEKHVPSALAFCTTNFSSFLPKLKSSYLTIAPFISSSKDGQPHPELNFVFDSYSGALHARQTNTPHHKNHYILPKKEVQFLYLSNIFSS